MNTENCAKRVDTKRFRLRYRTEKLDQKDEFWAKMFCIWHMFKWWYPGYSLRQFSEYFELPPSTVSRRFAHPMTWVLSRESRGNLNQSSVISETLDSLASKNDWHMVRLIWIYESARLNITKKQFCEKYGLSYNTARLQLAASTLERMLHTAHFHRYIYFEQGVGWLYPIWEPARQSGLMSNVLAEFRGSWGMN